MATSLAAQLAQIAAKSRSSLNVKAQKAAHTKSLIFEPRIAAGQSYQTIYTACRDGFEELCQLDARFTPFSNTLFSEQSQDEDRSQMTQAENKELDRRVDSFLRLVGSRLRLMPAIKAIEWLIRRFRIHEFNTSTLLATFLPYHSIPAFVTLLSILPADLPQQYKFLAPYVRSLTAPPRAAIVYQATHHREFLTAITEYTLDACRNKQQYPALVSFWAGVMTEAVNGRIDINRSGDAMTMKDVPDIQIAAYMVVSLLAAKANFDDKLLSVFMEQLVIGWTAETVRPGLVCLSILAQYRAPKQLSSRVAKALLKMDDLPQRLVDASKQCRVDKLAYALVLALADRLAKKGDARGLPIIKSILLLELLQEKLGKVAFKSLLRAALKMTDEVDQDGSARKQLGSTLVLLSQSAGATGVMVRQVIEDEDYDIEGLELRLDTSFGPRRLLEDKPAEEDAKDLEVRQDPKETLEAAIERLAVPPRSVKSFLSQKSDQLFDDMCKVLLSVATDPDDLLKFDEAPFLCRQTAHDDSYYFSFYMRVWCGPYPTLIRSAALEMAKRRLKQGDCAALDLQAMIPYCVAALSDPAKKVRQAAADLITVLSKSNAEGIETAKRPIWASKQLYEQSNEQTWMNPAASRALLQEIIVPALEESVLDEEHISNVLRSHLQSTKDSATGPQLSSAVRLSIFSCITSHVVHTPLLAVKSRLLKPTNQVDSVSKATRTSLLLPLLRWWASLSSTEAAQLCERERIDESKFNQSCVNVAVANDKPGLETLFEIITNSSAWTREGLVEAAFARTRKIWSTIKSDSKLKLALSMLDLAQTPATAGSSAEFVSEEAADFLRNVDLTTNILNAFLESLQDIPKITTDSPATKRRRTSSSDHSRGVSLQATNAVKAALNKVTFVLQLVEGSKPAEHPELLQSLFVTLADLQVLRSQVGSELGYLQNLVLSSLLAMMPTYKNNKSLKIDTSVGHGDVLVQCIQKSSSPAVQNSALLLVASLANTAPDVVLHSVMPIFTFMGGSVLRQSDDYSAHVVVQTIKEVIPPLVETFRKSRRNLVTSAAELLSSFVIAYEHIPSHRKRDMFISLIENLGPKDFLAALVAMFVDKYGTTDSMVAFCKDLMNSFGVEVQLQSLVMLLDLVSDCLQPKPTLAATLFNRNTDDDQDLHKTALKELTLLPKVLSSRQLRTEVSQLAGRDDMEASKFRELYASLLEKILTLAETVKTNKALHARCSDTLAGLLNLLSIGEFIKAVENLLDRPSISLRQKVLRTLEVRVDQESNTDADSRTVLLAFLPQLTAVIRDSDDIAYKHTAVACVDKIAEKYGKKDLEAVAAAATTIAGDCCLGQPDKRLRVMALLCLASLVDVLQDGIVPTLPVSLPKALSYLSESLQGEKEPELHNAVYSFFESLAVHVPYMLTKTYIGQLLAVSNVSAEANMSDESSQARFGCLQLLANQVDANTMLAALEQNWAQAVNAGFSAVEEYLKLLATVLDKHPSTIIAKHISTLSTIFLSALDLRRNVQSKDTVSIAALAKLTEIEALINDVALKMIYKLNDSKFRTVFTQLMEWVATGLPKDDKLGKVLRHQSVYSFLLAFFDNLKDVVASYASYIIDDATAILKASDPSKMEDRELWQLVLKTLARCFEHDSGGFWQVPAHFEAVSGLLVEQLEHAAALGELPGGDLVQNAVVGLAEAAASRDHRKELNAAVLRRLRSPSASVRLAAVRCEQSLTDTLGEDWLEMLSEMLPYISELQDDDDEDVEKETHRWITKIEAILGESLDAMLQ
ncbi:U3 small nucleolar RNA-associated protein 10 [Pyricularia oryzae Y34]|uniref:U3 small nucleolar RNA-associated protein 10 n=1 Tax=Pyricularia oryzae (strain Y34) TaxID=1143189 RepID=A0AA97P9U1_PYRO3|nr:U3 small nucleolar RNA-associated protein 10 [Pyricularia oryzae Y34]